MFDLFLFFAMPYDFPTKDGINIHFSSVGSDVKNLMAHMQQESTSYSWGFLGKAEEAPKVIYLLEKEQEALNSTVVKGRLA